MSDIEDIHELMYKAVLCLCGSDSWKQRIEYASFELHLLELEGLDEPLRREIESIHNMTVLSDGHLIKELREREMNELIEKILNLYSRTIPPEMSVIPLDSSSLWHKN